MAKQLLSAVDDKRTVWVPQQPSQKAEVGGDLGEE
jgi:hypothetical protein